MKTQSKESLNPKSAQEILIKGNKRFTLNHLEPKNLIEQVSSTSKGQFPFAVILSCIDSRVPVELVFDQGIGDVFSVRVAGNIVNEDVLGSIEYGCKVAGSKLVVVLGHTKCGAVTAACNGVELGNITPLLSKIQPAVDEIKMDDEIMTEKSIEEVSI
ncbi:MAG: carbonic anhydrase, partial [Flavobacteriales bacterium]|nr:carbonic anhydrase [Flavobacteriales bacterium]